MAIQRLALMCCVFLSCCISQKKEHITDFPIRPELMVYPAQPVIQKIDQNFLVTPELIYNTTMLKDYYKRIDLWKENHNIR
jgi:hypothetical protein